jgi:hypothetical protein
LTVAAALVADNHRLRAQVRDLRFADDAGGDGRDIPHEQRGYERVNP